MARIGYARVSTIDQDPDTQLVKLKAEGVYSGGKRRLDRAKIIELFEQGCIPANIAKDLGCSRMQVYRILNDR